MQKNQSSTARHRAEIMEEMRATAAMLHVPRVTEEQVQAAERDRATVRDIRATVEALLVKIMNGAPINRHNAADVGKKLQSAVSKKLKGFKVVLECANGVVTLDIQVKEKR